LTVTSTLYFILVGLVWGVKFYPKPKSEVLSNKTLVGLFFRVDAVTTYVTAMLLRGFEEDER
jgi:hypothetical protein